MLLVFDKYVSELWIQRLQSEEGLGLSTGNQSYQLDSTRRLAYGDGSDDAKIGDGFDVALNVRFRRFAKSFYLSEVTYV